MKLFIILVLFFFSWTIAVQTTDKNVSKKDKGAIKDWVDASLPSAFFSVQAPSGINSKVKVAFVSETQPEQFWSVQTPRDFEVGGSATGASAPLGSGNGTTEVPMSTTVKKIKMYQMWRFKNFENVPTYVPMRRRGGTRTTTKAPTNGEGDYKIIEINSPKDGDSMRGALAKDISKESAAVNKPEVKTNAKRTGVKT